MTVDQEQMLSAGHAKCLPLVLHALVMLYALSVFRYSVIFRSDCCLQSGWHVPATAHETQIGEFKVCDVHTSHNLRVCTRLTTIFTLTT